MKISDFHSDILTYNGGEQILSSYTEETVVTAVFRGKRDFKAAEKLAEKADILAFEDAGYTDAEIKDIVRYNPVYVGLTWNGENRYGYGCDYACPLKADGRAAIRELNDSGVAVDTAHISKGGFYDIIDLAETVVNSHTCFSGAFQHKRNIDDEQIRLLISRNAPIGVTLCGYFMTDKPQCLVEDFTRQIDYFVSKFGFENLCIGTDFYGCDFFPDGINDYSGLSLVKERLIKLGYSGKAINGIFYDNLNGFLERKWKAYTKIRLSRDMRAKK